MTTSQQHHFVAYLHSPEETLAQYHATLEGISTTERKSRLEVYGNNILTHKKRTPGWIKFLQQFKDLMIILLIASAGIARLLGDTRTMIILSTLILINAAIGYFQEAQAERLLEKLSSMVHAKAKVHIQNEEQEIESAQLVPGDILLLQEGDALPADIRIIEERNLQTNDFSLTGESNPKRKHAHTMSNEVELGDRTNLCFMGTTVATGNAVGVVIGTGMNTELGRIASLSTETSNDLSPLQKELNHTAKMLTGATLILAVLLFSLALWLDRPIHEALLFAIGIAASMVPQGLPAQINIALTSSAGLLAKKFALVKKLSAVETLGAVNVICTDKTGTLTTNEMTVQEIWHNDISYTVTEIGYEPFGTILDKDQKKTIIDKDFELFLSVGALASNAHLHEPDAEHPKRYIIGDPTEGALLTVAGKAGITAKEFEERYPLVQEFSFDSSRKRMSMVRQRLKGGYRIYVKGSLQTMLPTCTHIFIDGKTIPLTQSHKEELTARDDMQAKKAMRNLTYAYKDITSRTENLSMEEAESGLTLLGMVSMIDPPRESVPAAIQAAKDAHIKIVVITGDYALTAKAIGEKIGLHTPGTELPIFTGQELRNMSDIAVTKELQNNDSLIFSRVAPEDKVRIVSLCKKHGWIVAVTGDGVNDAPALKQADIGVAMGKTGTDVSKEASEIILLDDSFAILVDAISQGRTIYQNITKTVLSCITTNWAELFAVLFGLAGNIFTGAQMAITTIQILAIDLIGEMGPLAALSRDPAQAGTMQQPARDTHKHILRKGTLLDIILSGAIMAICAYLAYRFVIQGGDPDHIAYGQTTTYLTIVLSQFVNILTRRIPDNNFFSAYLRSNKKLIKAIGISLILILSLFYIPQLRQWFNFAPLGAKERVLAIGGAFIYACRRQRAQGRGKKFFE